MSTLLTLAKNLDKLATDISLEANRLAIAVGKSVLLDLVKKTPVDTSNALSNWIVSLGKINDLEPGPYYLGSRGSTFVASSNAAYEVGSKELDGKRPGETIFISNSTDYIEKLDSGSSQQEPAGFVYRAVVLGRTIIGQWVWFGSNSGLVGTSTAKWIPKGRR
jgi:hypothetical protein